MTDDAYLHPKKALQRIAGYLCEPRRYYVSVYQCRLGSGNAVDAPTYLAYVYDFGVEHGFFLGDRTDWAMFSEAKALEHLSELMGDEELAWYRAVRSTLDKILDRLDRRASAERAGE